MKIKWNILKKRGNHRPVLKYELELESFEVDLALPQVVVAHAVPKPPNSWRSFCYPGQDERAGAGMDWYRLTTPTHKSVTDSGSLTLAWRDPDAGFEDVEAAFVRLRRDFELVLTQAYESAPLDIVETLELTEDTRKHIAAGVATARFLSAVGF